MKTTMIKETVEEMIVRLEYDLALNYNAAEIDSIEEEILANRENMPIGKFINLLSFVERRRNSIKEMEKRRDSMNFLD